MNRNEAASRIEMKQGIASWSKPAVIGAIAAVMGGLALPGCTAIGFMAESYRRDSTREVVAEYTGLEGKSFAVIVTADRMIEADHPGLVERLTAKITQRLSEPTNIPRAGGFVPAKQVMRYLYDNPSWPARPLSELAKGLGGVERLIYIELTEYRLNDPGNAYEWEGVATGNVAIVETDGIMPDSFSYEKVISVKFPDQRGMGPNQLNFSGVTSVLSSRFIDRASWLFYNHQEPYYPDY